MRSASFIVVALALLALLCISHAQAGVVCGTRDCSDVLGDFLVKDNRLSSKIITHRAHNDHMEESRVRRIDILRRERMSM